MEKTAHLDAEVSPVFVKIAESKKKITSLEGGTGAGKTYSILQYLILIIGLQQTNNIISITRSTLAELRSNAMRDFFNILQKYKLYNPLFHNKTDRIYYLNGNIFEFLGMDKAEKKKGSRRDYLYCNEVIDLNKEDWFQLSVRTRKKIYVDFNPTEMDSWIYDIILSRKDCNKIHCTYQDNWDFLGK
ncbi:MAG: phage terminase large subunit, partial [Thermodesulfobacteriota bacterium]